jgi:hypothetical protein
VHEPRAAPFSELDVRMRPKSRRECWNVSADDSDRARCGTPHE